MSSVDSGGDNPPLPPNGASRPPRPPGSCEPGGGGRAEGPGAGGMGAARPPAESHGGHDVNAIDEPADTGGTVLAMLFGIEPGKPIDETVWAFLETPGTSYGAILWAFVMLCVILTSCAAFVIESMPSLCCGRYDKVFGPLETGCIILFTVEYLARLFSVPLDYGLSAEAAEKQSEVMQAIVMQLEASAPGSGHTAWRQWASIWEGVKARSRFLVNFLNVIDFVAIFPFYLELVPP